MKQPQKRNCSNCEKTNNCPVKWKAYHEKEKVLTCSEFKGK